jgi:putative Ca2+/H+ antiporter (TMEM165/GDT1 family)
VVALAEMGDKTQLVALSMASRYRRPLAVLLGILIATTINHALASSVGVWAATHMPAAVVHWVLGQWLTSSSPASRWPCRPRRHRGRGNMIA